MSTSEEGDMLCRQLQIANEAKGMTAQSVYEFCRQADGSWKVRSGKPSADSKAQ